MNFYSFKNYRALLKAIVNEKKRSDSHWSFHKLAQIAGIQRSYMSKVLSGTAELSADQLFLIADELKWTQEQTDYVYLLLEYSKCAVTKRRELLLQKITLIQADKANTSLVSKSHSKESLEDTIAYYANPWTAIVHRALLIPRYAANYKLLGVDLRLDVTRVNSIIDQLLKLQFIEWNDKKILVLQPNPPVITNSDLQELIKNASTIPSQPRHAVAEQLRTIFLGDEASMRHLQIEIQKLVMRATHQEGATPKEDLYQLDLNLFCWTKS
jgi:uncharacterized protein (TIGR02147 family)